MSNRRTSAAARNGQTRRARLHRLRHGFITFASCRRSWAPRGADRHGSRSKVAWRALARGPVQAGKYRATRRRQGEVGELQRLVVGDRGMEMNRSAFVMDAAHGR